MTDGPCIHGVANLGLAGCRKCEIEWRNMKRHEHFKEFHGEDAVCLCATCEVQDTCDAAFDLYNIGDSCLMDK